MNAFLLRALCALVLFSLTPAAPAAEARTKTKSAETSTKATKVDVNTADASTLESLPGIGRVTAQAIIAARPFKSVDDLASVPGIGPSRLAELRGQLKVSDATSARATTSASRGKTATHEPSASAASPIVRIELNSADQTTLETLPGVGPATAKAIMEARPFKTVDDLSRVPGIGEAKLKNLRTYVYVEAPPKHSGTRTSNTTASTSAETGASKRHVRTSDETPNAPAQLPSTQPTGRDSGFPGASTPTVRSSSGHQAGTARQGLIDLNTASKEELESLPEIGPVKAQAIIDARPFRSTEDVMRVKGIKQATFDAIRDQITVR
jgi:competence protein ComEA